MRWIKNKIGNLLRYGNCICGDSFWWKDIDNPGIYKGNGIGKIICTECYLKDYKKIDKNNRNIMMTEGK